jgi:CheY-like chemotaxis protein
MISSATKRFARTPMTTILVVDDEPPIRSLLGFALSRGGMTPLLASNGQEAIDLFKEKSGTIDLVLLDILMPGMTGPETLTRLRELDPAVPCCFLSGNVGNYGVAELLAMGATAVFMKPILDLAQFVSALAQLL